MRVSIDKAGRVVIPKGVRDQLGIQPGQELDLDSYDGAIRLSVPTRSMRIEGHGKRARIVADGDMPVLTAEMVRDALEAGRDRR